MSKVAAMARARIRTAMRAAMKAAGLEVKRCRIHPREAKPCSACDRAFKKAFGERAAQRAEEQKATHAAFLAAGGRDR